MVDLRNRQRREKGKSRVSFLADQSAILMPLALLATYEREVLVYFVASILCRGNLPAYFTTTFMAIKLLFEPLVYSNVPLSLLFSFAFKISKWSK